MEGELTILVVDDMEGCRELYREWLTGECQVQTAATGEEGVEKMDHNVDLAILDRDMPGKDGREVAVEIEAQGYDVHIVMISWMSPDFDIVEYPIDSYVEKPVTEADMLNLIEQYERQRSYQAALEEYFALSSKLAAIEAEQSAEALESNPKYERLKDRVADKRKEVDEAISTTSTDWNYAFKSCARALEAEVADGDEVLSR